MNKMKKRTVLAAFFSVLALSGVVAANLANASGGSSRTPEAISDSDSVDHECPPACNAQDKADEATEVQVAEGSEEAEGAPEAAEASEGEGTPGAEADGDTHEDAGDQAEHECPPACDTANGETP